MATIPSPDVSRAMLSAGASVVDQLCLQIDSEFLVAEVYRAMVAASQSGRRLAQKAPGSRGGHAAASNTPIGRRTLR